MMEYKELKVSIVLLVSTEKRIEQQKETTETSEQHYQLNECNQFNGNINTWYNAMHSRVLLVGYFVLAK